MKVLMYNVAMNEDVEPADWYNADRYDLDRDDFDDPVDTPEPTTTGTPFNPPEPTDD